MPRNRTQIRFVGKIDDFRIVRPKEDAPRSYGAPKPNGKTIIAFAIERPLPPTEPEMPYRIKNGDLREDRLKTAPRKKRDESDEDFEQRKRDHAEQLAERQRLLDRHARDMEHYERSKASYGDRLRSYASIAGVVAGFGEIPMTITIAPQQGDVLTQLGLLELAPPPEAPDEIDEPTALVGGGLGLDDDEDE